MDLSALKNSELFHNISETDISVLLTELQAKCVTYKNGDIIFPVGSKAENSPVQSEQVLRC